MGNLKVKRITKELAALTKKVDESGKAEFQVTDYIKIKPVDDKLTELRAEIKGPPQTQYEGQTFDLSIKFPERYPFVEPNVKFITKISHPNIDGETGEVCEHFLCDWVSGMNIAAVLMNIYCLLGSPVPKP